MNSEYHFEQSQKDIYEVKNKNVFFSSDKNKLNIPFLHKTLNKLYWAKGIPLDRLIKSMTHSVCYGLYQDNEQIGFARVVTDYSQEAILCDVFIDETHRSQGLGKFLIKTVLESPITNECFRWLLLTKDAHAFYKNFGFDRSEFTMFKLIEKNY